MASNSKPTNNDNKPNEEEIATVLQLLDCPEECDLEQSPQICYFFFQKVSLKMFFLVMVSVMFKFFLDRSIVPDFGHDAVYSK